MDKEELIRFLDGKLREAIVDQENATSDESHSYFEGQEDAFQEIQNKLRDEEVETKADSDKQLVLVGDFVSMFMAYGGLLVSVVLLAAYLAGYNGLEDSVPALMVSLAGILGMISAKKEGS